MEGDPEWFPGWINIDMDFQILFAFLWPTIVFRRQKWEYWFGTKRVRSMFIPVPGNRFRTLWALDANVQHKHQSRFFHSTIFWNFFFTFMKCEKLLSSPQAKTFLIIYHWNRMIKCSKSIFLNISQTFFFTLETFFFTEKKSAVAKKKVPLCWTLVLV